MPPSSFVTGVHDLVNVLSDSTLPLISSGKNAQDVVEVMSGFVMSAHRGHVPVSLPLPRVEVAAEQAVAEAARL